MAQIHEEHVVIKLSKLVKDGETSQPVVTAEIRATLEELTNQLLDGQVVVEVVDLEA
jgi:hypothetical protein